MIVGIRKFHLWTAIALGLLLPLLLAAAVLLRHADAPQNSLEIPKPASNPQN